MGRDRFYLTSRRSSCDLPPAGWTLWTLSAAGKKKGPRLECPLPRQTRSTGAVAPPLQRRRSGPRKFAIQHMLVVTTSTDSGSSHHWLLQVVDGPPIPRFGLSSGAVFLNTRGPRRWAFPFCRLVLLVDFHNSIPSFPGFQQKDTFPIFHISLRQKHTASFRSSRYGLTFRDDLITRSGLEYDHHDYDNSDSL